MFSKCLWRGFRYSFKRLVDIYLNIWIIRSRFLCVIAESCCAFVDDRAIEISSSLSNYLI